MTVQHPHLREALLAMEAEDRRVRAELAADGSLFRGYHPRMEELHRRNASALRSIIDEIGWPNPSLVGRDGAGAAWTILQHSIGEPDFMRRGLELVREASRKGEVEPLAVAMLEDRIRSSEGKGQRYGTQFDWDEDGRMSPLPLDDPEGVDERRRQVGLDPLADHVRGMREGMEGERPPEDLEARRKEQREWLARVGWRP